MISICQNKISKYTLLLILGFFVLPFFVQAQATMSLSISPTLYEMTANPSQDWSSVIRVINPNPFEITVYVEPVNFIPDVNSGQGSFVYVNSEATRGTTLAEWISFEKRSLTIPAEQTLELPFTVSVPKDTGPGGYYGAIFVGTKPPETDDKASRVETAQVITSLIFLRVSGDVKEEGWIRSFRTTKSLLEKPEATFELRFENTGNVFLQPQGEIEIFNMWGQVRGSVPVNRETMFGIVPQESIRKFNFSWKGDWSIADMGRYTAIATLAYGAESKQFTFSETNFWVIPWKALLSVIVVIFSFAFFMVWAIKLYIRRMLALAGIAPGAVSVPRSTYQISKRKSLVAPIEIGILDLRNRFSSSTTINDKFSVLWEFIKNYRWFFVSIMVVVAFLVSLVWYIGNASQEESMYEVTVAGTDSELIISSEQLDYEAKITQPIATTTSADRLPKINLVNRSGEPGVTAAMRIYLEENSVPVNALSIDFEGTQHNTVVVYNDSFVDQALEISKLLDNALLSSYTGDPVDGVPVVIYVGSDYADAIE